MNRLLVILALVFTLASVGGPALAHARVAEAAPRAMASEACAAEEGRAAPALYKTCHRKAGNVAIACPYQPKVLPVGTCTFLAVGEPRFERLPIVSEWTSWVGERQFRPPRA